MDNQDNCTDPGRRRVAGPRHAVGGAPGPLAGFHAAERAGVLWRCLLRDDRAQWGSARTDRALRQRPVCGCPETEVRRADHLREVHGLEGTEAEIVAAFVRAPSVPDRMVASWPREVVG